MWAEITRGQKEDSCRKIKGSGGRNRALEKTDAVNMERFFSYRERDFRYEKRVNDHHHRKVTSGSERER